MNIVVTWFGKYWNAVVLLLLLAGAIAIILLWPAKAQALPSVIEPHMNPGVSSGSVDVVVYGFFAVVFLVIVCFLGYIVILLRRKTSKEAERLPQTSNKLPKKEPEQKEEEW